MWPGYMFLRPELWTVCVKFARDEFAGLAPRVQRVGLTSSGKTILLQDDDFIGAGQRE